MNGYVDADSDHNLTLAPTRASGGNGGVGRLGRLSSASNAGSAKLADDDGYFNLLDDGQEFLTEAPQDFIRQALHGSPGAEAPPIGAVSTVTTAVVAGGQYDHGVSWGIEMAQLVEEITKQPTMFLLDSYGTFGQVTWLSGAPDLETADAAGDAINANDKYMKRLGDAGDLFVPASGQRRLMTRIA